MEKNIISSLQDLGYQGPLIEIINFKKSIEYGPKNIEYTKLVNYLTRELRSLINIDEEVNAISNPDDAVSFSLEISSFLKEMNCPYQSLTQGHVSERLQNAEDRELLLDYLVTELMVARMNQEKMPKKKIELKLQETPEAANLREILITLNFAKPPSHITIEWLFRNLTTKVEGLVKEKGIHVTGKAFFSGFLSEKQWNMLSELQKELNNDYKIRREMLLTRLDVTIQSFQWSDRAKGKEDFFEKVYKSERGALHAEPNVDLSHLLAARTDLAIIEKTSSANVRKNTSTSIQKVIIGQVPDRGGRTNEIAPPPPEMPSWQQRTPGPQNMGRGGFNQSRGRGNYNQGNGRGGYNQGGGQQAYSRGNTQPDSGRGNNSFGNSSNRSQTGSITSSSISNSSESRPFSNFNTSLSMYSAYSPSFSKLGNSSTKQDCVGPKVYESSDKDYYSNVNKGSAQNFDSAGSYENPNKRPRSSYGSSNKDFSSYNYSQKRSFNIAGDNEEKGNYNSRTNYGGDRQSNYTAYDSAGSYETNKRVKSYDSFKTDNMSYSDQYVRDNQHNQQSHSRNESSRGRSNYHRGQGNRYKR